MADNKLLQQMLEHLVNDEQQKAEELFHEYVVTKSREIYEGLIESEISEEEDKDDEEDEDMEEAASDEEAEEDKVDENFEDIAIEADDEMGDMGGDATDDLEADLDADMEDEGEEKSEEELFMDLEAIVDELQAKFDELKGEEDGEDMGDMGDDEEVKDDFELETVREYVEKVAPAKMGDNGVNNKSTVAGKNDMGGTTANLRGGESKGEGTAGGLASNKPQAMNTKNVNVPGAKGATKMSNQPGHGAEKKGAGPGPVGSGSGDKAGQTSVGKIPQFLKPAN
jgi:hypothetical protein